MNHLNMDKVTRGWFRIASHRIGNAPVGLETLPKTFAESPYAALAGRVMVSAAPAWRVREEADLKSVFRSWMSRGVFLVGEGRSQSVSGWISSRWMIDPRSPRGENPLKV